MNSWRVGGKEREVDEWNEDDCEQEVEDRYVFSVFSIMAQ